jgi:hypothetical protein
MCYKVLQNNMQPSTNVSESRVVDFVLRERSKTGRPRWISVEECPFSRAYVYDLINRGLIGSVAVKLPGSQRVRRLIDADSLDRFLESLMAEQIAAKAAEKEEGAAV